MDDIAREPLHEKRRTEAPARRGPAELIRLDECTVDELEELEELDGLDEPPPDDMMSRRDMDAPSDRDRPDRPNARPSVDPADRGVGGAARLGTERPLPPVTDELAEIEPVSEREPACELDGVAGAESDAAVASDATPEVDPGSVAEIVPDADTDTETETGPDTETETATEIEGVVTAAPLGTSLSDAPLDDVDPDSVPELTDPAELGKVVMAVLLSTREAMKPMRLAEVCNSTQKAVRAALELLERQFREAGLPLTVCWAGEVVRLATVADVFPYLVRMKKAKRSEKLTPAALETLAVVAYRQPAIRAEIEAIRGVKVGPMLRSLLDHKLVRVVGRAEVPGRPLQYGTTDLFLERFGLRSLKDLPSVQEFRSLG